MCPYGKDVAAEFVDFDATLCHLGQWQGVGVHLQHGGSGRDGLVPDD